MPTGYTSEIHEGRPVSFNDFVLGCARAMGACLHQRDDPNGPPVLRAPAPYRVKEIERTRAALEEAEKLSDEGWAQRAEEARVAALERWKDDAAKDTALRARYQAMRSQVEGWKPPTPDHEGLKTFMLEQLDSSINFDCHAPTEPKPITAAEFKEIKLAALRRDAEYYKERHTEDTDQAERVNEWIRQLYQSLGLGIPA